ncbi:PH domain-containing protein [Paludicola sp. MB14-C6]|uniref:PH domain-containing protein n=1 Tax=Paludihabitans sp. MB14-C6 TaxID=3070656 RepID=UPI0027DC66A4|nr:PH domain-containing protein [Paludicola sp. MB14-C6]WMJ23948.1 PH domain-containing protein [Paludicola sp. MB14-C6]
MEYKHSHVINIVEHTSKFLILLLLPAIRALFFTNVGFYAWLQGAWIDILTILFIIGAGLIAWYRYTYCFSKDGIYLKKGIFIVKERFIPYHKLSVVSIQFPFYLIPLKAVKLSADTDGGLPTTADFRVIIYKKQLDKIIGKVKKPFINPGEIKRVYLPKNIYIAILSFVVSNTLTGVLFVSTFISGLGKTLGKEYENQVVEHLTTLAQVFAFGIPPAAAIIAYVLLGGWGVSFLLNLIRNFRFSATRQGGSLEIQRGIITRRQYLITVKRINLVELRQTLLTKWFGVYTALIHSNGYGKGKDELSILMPAAEKHNLQKNIRLLLPEIPLCKPTLKSELKFLSRFLIPPIWWVIGATAFWLIGYWLFPHYSEMITFIGIMAEIPCWWYLFVKITSYFHTGIGLVDEVYTFNYTYGYRIKTIAVPIRRITKVTMRRSAFQLMSGCCDVIVYTYSEGKKRHVIPNLEFEKAKKMMDVLNCYEK